MVKIVGWIMGLLLIAMPCGAAVRTEFVDPQLTDPAIGLLTDIPGYQVRNMNHLAAIDPSAAVDRLYVHLSGSGGVPDNSQRVVNEAARLGYHAVSLAYPDYPSVQDLVTGQTDPDVAGQIRQERLYGQDTTSLITVSPSDSISNRLVKLLEYNAASHPTEGWDDFLIAGQPDWTRIVVGGHSQGAGYVAYLAKQYDMAGGIIFAGPGDYVNGQPASWLTLPNVTPATRLYAFTHLDDPNYVPFLITQQLMGLTNELGSPQNIDGLSESEMTSHRLVSALTPVPNDNYHGAVVVDEHLPLDAFGQPVYLPAWDYLFSQFLPVPEPASLSIATAGILYLTRRRRPPGQLKATAPRTTRLIKNQNGGRANRGRSRHAIICGAASL